MQYTRIKVLQKEKCDKIILKCLWNDHNTENHTAVQEAMARKGVKAGADLVIGYGNNSFLGCEWKGNSLILYGLGKPNVNKTEKNQNNNALKAEINFDPDHFERKPFVIMKPAPVGTETDLEQIIDRFVSDSTGEGISQIFFYQEDQSKQ